MDLYEDEDKLYSSDDYTKPEQPSELDCCNSGCNPCVFDLYELRLAQWKNGKKNNEKNSAIRYDLLSETIYKPFILLEKHEVTDNVVLLKFQPIVNKFDTEVSNNSDKLEQKISGHLPYRPGQHVLIKNMDNSLNKSSEQSQLDCNLVEQTGKELKKSLLTSIVGSTSSINENKMVKSNPSKQMFISRAYTPISLSSEKSNCVLDVIVKLYKNGVMSNYFLNLNTGDTVSIRGPCGNFQYISNSYQSILMICIGTGIAPLFTIIKHILSNESDETVVKLLFGCRQVSDIILRDELRSMTSFWNFSVEYFISDCYSNFVKKFGETFTFGRISHSAISKEFFKRCCRLTLICGSVEFSESIFNSVLKCGVDKKDVFVF